MTEAELRNRIGRFNVLHVGLGVILIPLTVAAWWASYWAIRLIAWIILYGFGEILETRWNIARVSHYVGLAGLLLLVVEGILMARTAAAVKEYFPMRHGWTFMQRRRSVDRNQLAGATFLVSHFFFAAPEATRKCIALLTGRLPRNEPTLGRAVRMLDRLAADRHWHPMEDDDATAAGVLHALSLIWLREEDGVAEVRIPPASDN